jgi:hypothetical protein
MIKRGPGASPEKDTDLNGFREERLAFELGLDIADYRYVVRRTSGYST